MADIGLIALRHGLTRFDVLNHCPGGNRNEALAKARRACAEYFMRQGKGFCGTGRIMRRDPTTIRYYLGMKRR